jgi:hypothetical protein
VSARVLWVVLSAIGVSVSPRLAFPFWGLFPHFQEATHRKEAQMVRLERCLAMLQCTESHSSSKSGEPAGYLGLKSHKNKKKNKKKIKIVSFSFCIPE